MVSLLLVLACGLFFLGRPERTEIRNLSGLTITNVVLELRDYRSDWSVIKRKTSLKPGASLRVRHSHTDIKAVVTFAIAGRAFRDEEGYIDLWTGEGWRFDIQPDGKVVAGYDYSSR